MNDLCKLQLRPDLREEMIRLSARLNELFTEMENDDKSPVIFPIELKIPLHSEGKVLYYDVLNNQITKGK